MEGNAPMNGIGWAVKHMQTGSKVKRPGWRTLEWIAYVPKNAAHMPQKITGATALGPFLVAKVVGEEELKVWNPTHADLLAVDWQIVDA